MTIRLLKISFFVVIYFTAVIRRPNQACLTLSTCLIDNSLGILQSISLIGIYLCIINSCLPFISTCAVGISANFQYFKSNQIFHYTRCITPKRVTSLRDPSPRHCNPVIQLLSKKCRSGSKPLAALCPI